MTVPARVRVCPPFAKGGSVDDAGVLRPVPTIGRRGWIELSRAYTRNRVRLDLLPTLERFNPSIRSVLARTADLAAEDLAALDTVV